MCFLVWLDVMWFCVSKVLLFVLSSKYMVIEICHRVYKWCNLGGWEKCWEQGLTPWDLGHPTPIILHLHQTGALPKGRALVPGCGSVSYFFSIFMISCTFMPPFFFLFGVSFNMILKSAIWSNIAQGYDVVAMACSERYVVGLDVSHTAIEKAIEVRAICLPILQIHCT